MNIVILYDIFVILKYYFYEGWGIILKYDVSYLFRNYVYFC